MPTSLNQRPELLKIIVFIGYFNYIRAIKNLICFARVPISEDNGNE